ncbi:putative protein-serine/threonine phosphatase [Helianthus annuus]|nr:putative protein-serine/threonine phosphatase [Helianthus annuus]KAJ0729673.1 putative protein-serine/threonine phosphatase [Helianthus annuus]
MAGMCCGETTSYRDSTPSTTEPSGGGRGRRRRMAIQQLKSIATTASSTKTGQVGCSTATVTTSKSFRDDVLEKESSRFGLTIVCGRRRDLEDAVSVATKCKDRMHEIVKEEVENCEDWKEMMMKSFARMDKDVSEWSKCASSCSDCRCQLQTPQSNAVGSTAVVAIMAPDKIVVSNCGDSRAVSEWCCDSVIHRP